MTIVGQEFCACKNCGERPEAGSAADQKHDQQLVFDSIRRSAPAKICLVIMPGRATSPIAAIALMVGIKPLRNASRTLGAMRCIDAPQGEARFYSCALLHQAIGEH